MYGSRTLFSLLFILMVPATLFPGCLTPTDVFVATIENDMDAARTVHIVWTDQANGTTGYDQTVTVPSGEEVHLEGLPPWVAALDVRIETDDGRTAEDEIPEEIAREGCLWKVTIQPRDIRMSHAVCD